MKKSMKKSIESMNDEFDINKMPFIYWDDLTKINYLQRMIIIYSIMYYNLNESCVSDKYYDSVSRVLCSLSKSIPVELLKQSQYYYCMHDFDGSTGFDIPYRLNDYDKDYLQRIALHIQRDMRGK